MAQRKYDDPFMVVTPNGLGSEVSEVKSNLAKNFDIHGGEYVEVGRRDFGVLGKVVRFTQPLDSAVTR